MKHRCVIVGAGIIGAALAAHLADQDAAVTVIEADEPGRGTSAASLAWVNSNDKPPRAYHDLNVAGLHAWRQWAARLDGDWFRPGGSLHWANPGQAAQLADHVARLADWQYPAQLLTPAEALRLEPDVAIPSDVRDVAYFPEEAYLFTTSAIQTLLHYATDRGVTLVTGDAVTQLLISGARVDGVRLSSGHRVDADTVVLCAGWRTPSLAAQIGVDVPIIPVDAPGSSAPCFVAFTEPAPHLLSRFLSTPDLDMRPAENGGIQIEGAEIDSLTDLSTSPAQLEAHAKTLLQLACRVLPRLTGTALATHRVCVRPLPEDGYSIVGRPAGVAGCYVIVTHSGVTLAAHLATLAADEILTGNDQPVLSPFRLQRFTAPGATHDATHPAH